MHIVYLKVYESDDCQSNSQFPVISVHRTGESVSSFSEKSIETEREESEQMEGSLSHTSCSPQSARSLKQSDCSDWERGRMHSEPAWTNHPFTH